MHGIQVLLLLATLPGGSFAATDLDLIELPQGFRISVYAEGVENARQMALGDKGTVFVGSRTKGSVYALTDLDGDQVVDKVRVIDKGLNMPSGIEFLDGSLYVAATSRILRYDDIERRLDVPPLPQEVTRALPEERHHGWKYLRFGPDGKLYFNVGAPCNVCEVRGFAQIQRIAADGTGLETYARGVRNSVGQAFHPVTGELWFTDNGRDMMGDDMPSDELNHAPESGMHFGFPFCHQGDTLDPELGRGEKCAKYVPPALNLGAHVAPLGLTFYTGDMFPAQYRNQLFIAEHGSWNRSSKVGYRIMLVRFDEQGRISGQDVFAQGWLQKEKSWGRPTDVMVMPDGALLVSDDQGGRIYRISYQPGE